LPLRRSFYDVLTLAINDVAEHGFDSEGRVAFWTEELRKAAESALQTPAQAEEMLRAGLATVYRRLVDRGEVARYHPGVSRFTLQRIAPRLRAELDRRILASASLIRMNRSEAIGKTLRRFAGWATSIPAGGGVAEKADAKKDVRKALSQLPFEERRCLIDQGHKLTAAINEIVASDGGAIALIWRSNFRQSGYDYREDHRERDGEVYLLESWASKAGLVKPGKAGWYKDVTSCGQEINCRCYAVFVYSLGDLPPGMLTKRGETELRRVRAASA
jgi:hypothetical protein